MRVLVVEDDDDKLSKVVEFIQAQFGMIREVKIAKSLQSGLIALLEEEFDLVILDMTLPNFDRNVTEDGGRTHAFGGREILRQMRRNRIATPTIVTTQFDRFGEENDFTTLDELKRELEDSFANYLGTVQYRENVDEWKGAFVKLAESALHKPERGGV